MSRPKKELLNPVLPNDELEQLRAKVAALEAQVQSRNDPLEEIRRAKNVSMGNTQGITYRHFTDAKKVSLYHTNGIHIGKKVGPLHPGNIESTYERFKAKGIILSINPPLPEQVSAYMKSDEYKALEKRQREVKAVRYRGETKSDIARLVDIMAKRDGINPNEVVQMKPQEAIS